MRDIAFGAFLMLIVVFGCSHISPLQEVPKEPIIEHQEKLDTIDFTDDESTELTELPHFKSAWSLARKEDKIDSNKITKALEIFYSEWNKKYGDPNGDLLNNIDDITITWGHELMAIENCYDVHGNHIDKGHASGLTTSKKTVWVYVGDRVISNTSLVHELIHIALWTLEPDSGGDADHEGDTISGWTKEHTAFIDKVNKKLKANGL